jgi:LPS-assembly lipoprotein
MWLSEMHKLRFLLLFGAVFLSACGFRLQGTGSLPPEFANTYIQASDRYTPFYRSLSKALRQRGVTVASGPSSATAIIEIRTDVSGKSVTAVSSRNIPLEYEAFYSVAFAVVVEGRRVMESDSIILTNRYEYDETTILGKEDEFERFSNSQADDIARQVLVQLAKL